METNQPISTKPVQQSTQDVSLPQVKNQLQYPFDYETQRAIDEYLKGKIGLPVGAIYISTVSTNPSTILGYGTWVAFGAGRTLVGVDTGQTEFDTVEETGGSKTHTLDISEIPSHSHTVNVGNTGYGTTSLTSAGTNNNFQAGGIGSTGGDGAHNNLQPYITVYFWKRTA